MPGPEDELGGLATALSTRENAAGAACAFLSGTGEADLAGETHEVDQGDLCAVPAGTWHNFRNTGDEPLVLHTIYSPPEHAPGAVHATKADADAAEAAGRDDPPGAWGVDQVTPCAPTSGRSCGAPGAPPSASGQGRRSLISGPSGPAVRNPDGRR